ncbi:hypothetical protein D4741_15760 [Pseudoalteromonas gelatinilytica]|uniref:Uncharacterized protein n=1 Tax=Pseudoalteromonas gelatinilytica TaxID=1703256 RepID=A0A3A3EMG7_9GAMM|nr:hypothetical protein D4741_15760 [Pseudoalteromonas profundi]
MSRRSLFQAMSKSLQHCVSNKFTALDITQLGHCVRYFCKFNANLINSIIILIKSQLFSTDGKVSRQQ